MQIKAESRRRQQGDVSELLVVATCYVVEIEERRLRMKSLMADGGNAWRGNSVRNAGKETAAAEMISKSREKEDFRDGDSSEPNPMCWRPPCRVRRRDHSGKYAYSVLGEGGGARLQQSRGRRQSGHHRPAYQVAVVVHSRSNEHMSDCG